MATFQKRTLKETEKKNGNNMAAEDGQPWQRWSTVESSDFAC